MSCTLRWYQEGAVGAVHKYLKDNATGNPCVVLPTGAGKTHVIRQLASDVVQWGGRVLILAHVKELLQQAASKLDGLDVGIYSAGLNRRDTDNAVIVAGIQSAYKRALEFGRFDLVIVDECHLVRPEGTGMYRQMVADLQTANPKARIVGLTATPYRLKEGYVCGPDFILDAICYSVGVNELIKQGFLCKLISKRTAQRMATDGVKVQGGDFVGAQLDHANSSDEIVVGACQELVEYCHDRHSALVFCCGRVHAHLVADVLREMGQAVGYIDGETPTGERAEVIQRFKRRELKYLVNINVLTTGFDATGVDCVAMMRPTLSPGLYYQMVGRGLRIDPDKQDCLVLDFGGNAERHGPIDKMDISPQGGGSGTAGVAPTRICEECQEILPLAQSRCPACGAELEQEEKEIEPSYGDETASHAPIISDEVSNETYEVQEVQYYVHEKRNAAPDAPKTLRVIYVCGFQKRISEWICLEHSGWAGEKASKWWRRRSQQPVPESAELAVELADRGALAETLSIEVKPAATRNDWPKVVGYELSDVPGREELMPPTSKLDRDVMTGLRNKWDAVEAEWYGGTVENLYDDEDIPF